MALCVCRVMIAEVPIMAIELVRDTLCPVLALARSGLALGLASHSPACAGAVFSCFRLRCTRIRRCSTTSSSRTVLASSRSSATKWTTSPTNGCAASMPRLFSRRCLVLHAAVVLSALLAQDCTCEGTCDKCSVTFTLNVSAPTLRPWTLAAAETMFVLCFCR